MHAARRLILSLVLSLTAVLACTKSVRVVEPLDYGTALTDTTLTFEIHTRDGTVFVSKKARLEADTLVVMRGHQVQEDPWRQKAASIPIRIPVSNIKQVSQVELARGQSFALMVTTFLVVMTIIGLHSIHIN